jgi:hypothetical protein
VLYWYEVHLMTTTQINLREWNLVPHQFLVGNTRTLTSLNYSSQVRAIASSHSLQFTTHALHLPSLLSLHQSSDTGFQRRTFPFLWVPELFPSHSHSNSWLAVRSTETAIALAPLHTLSLRPSGVVLELPSVIAGYVLQYSVTCYVLRCTVMSSGRVHLV